MRQEASSQAIYHLRSEPVTVSDVEAKQTFDVDDNGRPLVYRVYIENKFEDQGLVVVDHATGLTWQKSGSSNDITYQKTQAYIEKLNQECFGGYSDWRLPTVTELLSLMTRDEQSNGLYINSIFDATQRWCWSADRRITYEGSPGSAWLVNFDYGSVYWLILHYNYWVRAVRS